MIEQILQALRNSEDISIYTRIFLFIYLLSFMIVYKFGLPFKQTDKRKFTTKKVSHGFNRKLEKAKVYTTLYTEANAITILGILGLTAMIFMIYKDIATNALPFLFAVSVAYSDLLDGDACKKWDCHSKAGEILDPLRDRLAAIVIFFAIFHNVGIHYYWALPAFGIILLEINTATISLSSRKKGRVLSSHGMGQIRQVVHLVCSEIILANLYLFENASIRNQEIVLQLCLTVMAMFSFFALKHYEKAAKTTMYL